MVYLDLMWGSKRSGQWRRAAIAAAFLGAACSGSTAGDGAQRPVVSRDGGEASTGAGGGDAASGGGQAGAGGALGVGGALGTGGFGVRPRDGGGAVAGGDAGIPGAGGAVVVPTFPVSDASIDAFDAFERQYAAMFCARAFRCVPAIAELFASEQQCAATLTHPSELGPLREAVLHGDVLVDPSAVSGCLDASSATCDGRFGELPACRRVAIGRLGLGDPCFSSYACGPDAFCDGGCPGKCTPTLSVGAECGGTQSCASTDAVPLECRGPTPAPTSGPAVMPHCLTVVTGAAEGARCDFSGTQWVHCADGLWCDSTSTPDAPTCRKPIPEGSPCPNPAAHCTTGVCVGPSGQEICTRLTLVTQEGGSCGDPPQSAAICDPAAGLFCTPSGCVHSDGSNGAPCFKDQLASVYFECQPGLRCDFSTETCVPLLALGARCTGSWQCASRYCDSVCAPERRSCF